MTTTEYLPNLMIFTKVAATKRSLKVSHILWSPLGALHAPRQCRQVCPRDDDAELYCAQLLFKINETKSGRIGGPTPQGHPQHQETVPHVVQSRPTTAPRRATT